MNRFMVHGSWFMVKNVGAIGLGLLAFAMNYELSAMNHTQAYAEEPSSADTFRFGRADLLFRQGQYEPSLEEFGGLPKSMQEDPLFRKRVAQALAFLYRPKKLIQRISPVAGRWKARQTLRVTRHKKDADKNADQHGDERGYQVNESLSFERSNPGGIETLLKLDLDGYKDGHNDLRYRTVFLDFFKGPSHLALGDSATYASPYFLRASRLRGFHLLISGEGNEFQALAGAYPVWLEDRDAYIYPRWVWGIRDRVRLKEDRFRLGVNLVQTRDNEKIRNEDRINPQARVDPVFQPRDNIVVSLDQEIKLIENIWFLKAAEAYSYTDENLLTDRFGDTTKLKDTAFEVESLFIQPLFRWRGTFERVGPDFRLLTDLPQGSVISPKDIRADTLKVSHFLDLEKMGPFDLDLEASWIRNNLDHDAGVGHIRQGWLTADFGILTPSPWPQPRIRSTLYETVSSPGSSTRPSQSRTLDLTGEFTHTLWGTHLNPFVGYQRTDILKDRPLFDEESRRWAGIRLNRPLGERLVAHARYRFLDADELFDEVRSRGHTHEAGAGFWARLWSNASVSLDYNTQRGDLILPREPRKVAATTHSGTLNFQWPYQWKSWDRRRKLTVFPTITTHLTDTSDNLQRRPLVSGRLTLGYEVYPDWKLELLGEFRRDYDEERSQLRTQTHRLWALFTSRWD